MTENIWIAKASSCKKCSLPVGVLTEKLVETIGCKLTAHVGGVRDARAADLWISGGEISGKVEGHLRFAYRAARMLGELLATNTRKVGDTCN
jgi:hypothetical protein